MGSSHLVMIIAEVVFPIPGGPLSSTAFLLMSFGLPRPFWAPASSPCRCTASLHTTYVGHLGKLSNCPSMSLHPNSRSSCLAKSIHAAAVSFSGPGDRLQEEQIFSMTAMQGEGGKALPVFKPLAQVRDGRVVANELS